jgi:hypothetical protein
MSRRHTYLYGGYLTKPGAGGGPPPQRTDAPPPPSFKHTTAADMAHLAAWLADAAAGSGPLVRHGVSRHEVRELLYLLLHAADPGLVRPGVGRRPAAHKIAWLETSQDDVAVVFTRHGPVVVTVYAQGRIDATVYAFGRAVARAAVAGSDEVPGVGPSLVEIPNRSCSNARRSSPAATTSWRGSGRRCTGSAPSPSTAATSRR